MPVRDLVQAEVNSARAGSVAALDSADRVSVPAVVETLVQAVAAASVVVGLAAAVALEEAVPAGAGGADLEAAERREVVADAVAVAASAAAGLASG